MKSHKLLYALLTLLVKMAECCIDFVIDGSAWYEDTCKRIRKWWKS